ncbi:solute carrier family 15 member 4-like [Halichondria panicea]|uniref:solute carrier family 15 member 4-like n=1 Tax=Halichondria panicea TaxID=6063 RepID=UPI00312BBCB0
MAINARGNKKRTCKWRVRWFYSKGAYLVLVWNLLVNFSFATTLLFSGQFTSYLTSSPLYVSILIAIVPVCSLVISAPLSGWLADAKLGNLKVHTIGIFLIFLSTLVTCVLMLTTELFNSNGLKLSIFSVISSLSLLGYGAFLSTSVQLGLDQMPEASSENISSFLNWHYFLVIASYWVVMVLFNINNKCVGEKYNLTYNQILSFFSVFCMSIVLISDFCLSSKCLVVEPKATQSLKTIYQVLKFAAKHKAPLNRSALTYWEEDIPSRLDLGKSRYGGPFTTEQVEDVKTVFRLFSLGLTTLFAYCFFTALSISRKTIIFSSLTECESTIVFVHIGPVSFFIGMLVQEFLIYPIARGKFPGTLKRIKATYFLIVTICVLCLILAILKYFGLVPSLSIDVIFSVSGGLLFVVFLPAELEFVCAQSPYNMRGLLVGLVYVKYASSVFFNAVFSIVMSSACTSEYCIIIQWSVIAVLILFGFVLFVFVVRRYKLRTRDDGFVAQQIIEEIYDRNLTAAAQLEQPRIFATMK